MATNLKQQRPIQSFLESSTITRRLPSYGLALSTGLMLGLVACGDPGAGAECVLGSLGCPCFSGNICLEGLSCYSGICVDLEEDETSGLGDDELGDDDSSGGDSSDSSGGDSSDSDGNSSGDPCGVGGEVLLYKQGIVGNNDLGLAVGTFSDYNNSKLELAEDFVIPDDEQCWCITGVYGMGFYIDEDAPANVPEVTVEFFPHNEAGVPLADPTASTTVQATEPEQEGFLEASFDEGIVLEAGTHWLSFSPILEYSEARWAWRVYDELYGFIAAARDSDQLAFSGLCQGWTPASACYNVTHATMQFEVYGVVGGEECN